MNKQQEQQPNEENEISDSVEKKGSNQGNEKISKGNKEQKKESKGAEKAVKSVAGSVATKGATHIGKTMLMAQLKLKLSLLFHQLLHAVMSTTVGMIAVVTIVSIAIVVSAISGFISDLTAQKDSKYVECIAYIDRSMIGRGGRETNVDINKLQRQTAKRIYSVYFYYGLRPEQIFGVLGNWKHESELDPTSVETVMEEPFRIGKTKQTAISKDFVLKKWNPEYSKKHPDIKRNGIGLGQWTNTRNEKLVKYAKNYGLKERDEIKNTKDKSLENLWYNLDVQLAFSIDTSKVGDTDKAKWFKKWADIGAETWDGDKNITVDFAGKSKWATVSTKDTYGKHEVSVHPVGENNNEETIGSDKEDDYYKDTDRDQSKIDASKEVDPQWESILDSHTPTEWTDDKGIKHNNVNECNEAARKDYLKIWKKKYRYYLYKHTVERYTKQFQDEWEGCNDGTDQKRIDNALEFFEEWWKEANKDESQGEPNFYVGADNATDSNDYFFFVEEGYGSGIVSAINKVYIPVVNYKLYKYDQDMTECNRIVYEYRLDIAKCATMIAWPTKDQSKGNDGTELYKWIHDKVIDGDTIYQSCDRTVCTAVRWSGYDDDYPKGATLNQIQYLVSSPRWVELEWGGDRNQLQAGDVLIRKDSMASDATAEEGNAEHHTLIYVGNEIARNYYDSDLGEITKNACIVHGSFNERSPALDVWHENYSTYHAFRCIHPLGKNNSKYNDVSIAPNLSK